MRYSEWIAKVDRVINDSDHYINEVVSELKRRVDLKHELIKLKVEQAAHSILDKLVDYETKCKEQAKNKIIKMQTIKLATKNELDKWMIALNELKFDENVWKNIRGQSEIKTNQLLEALAVLKEEFMLNEYEEKNEEIKHYENIDMDSLFVFKHVKIDSVIVMAKLRKELLKLCEFKPATLIFSLLYRASRDGFGAKDFHLKCDNKPKTLTVIKTREAYVFGGYTEAVWNSNPNTGQFLEYDYYVDSYENPSITKNDPHAFIYSLVNKQNQPIKLDINSNRSHHAITCSSKFGPIFGGSDAVALAYRCGYSYENENYQNQQRYDIYISDYSNSNYSTSFINAYSTKNLNCSSNAFLAGSERFLVDEIEVFQLV